MEIISIILDLLIMIGKLFNKDTPENHRVAIGCWLIFFVVTFVGIVFWFWSTRQY